MNSEIYKNEGHKIAFISFTYKNRDLILGLKKRGDFISQGDFKGLKKFEEEFNQQLLDEDNIKNYSKPIRAYITFFYQEGYERCAKYLIK